MVPPLKVFSKEDEATAQFVEETRLTKGQFQGDEIGTPRGKRKTICNGATSYVAKID